MCNRITCTDVQELPYSHYGDDPKDSLLNIHILYTCGFSPFFLLKNIKKQTLLI